jgi:arginine decarboxylase
MPGENTGRHDEPTLRYLRALEAFDHRFPGFPSEIHGVHRANDTGDYWITCLKE